MYDLFNDNVPDPGQYVTDSVTVKLSTTTTTSLLFRQIENIFGRAISMKVITLSTNGTIDNYQLSTDSPQRASKPWPRARRSKMTAEAMGLFWKSRLSHSVQSILIKPRNQDTALTLPVHCRQACQAIRLTISCVSETFFTRLRSSFRGQNSRGFIAIPCNYAFSETPHR